MSENTFGNHISKLTKLFEMDKIILRFPHVTEKIFGQLDNPSLVLCQTVSRPWNNYLNDQKFLYERIMTEMAKSKPFVGSEESWNRILKKLNSKTVMELYYAMKAYLEEARTIYCFYRNLTPLHIAAYSGSVPLYEKILEKSQAQNPKTNLRSNSVRNRTPIDIAANKGHFLLCKSIMESMQDKNPVSSGVCSALFEAAGNGHVEVCKLLMDSIDDKNPEVAPMGRTPLHIASGRGHLEVVKLIMEKLIDKNPKADDWGTPLHEAAYGGHLEICQLILDNVDDKNPTMENHGCIGNESYDFRGGWTPLHNAAINGQVDVCKLIIDSIDNNPLSRGATEQQTPQKAGIHPGLITYYFEPSVKKAKKNENDENKNPKAGNGQTPLHVASENGHLEVCKLIIEKVNDKNPKCEILKTPLHCAAIGGHLEICRLILNNVQDKNPTDLDGRTPLEIAAMKGQLETCKLLMSYIEVKDQYFVARDTFNRSKGWPKMDSTVDPFVEVDLTEKHVEVRQYLQTFFENSVPFNEAGNAKRFKSL